MILLGATTQSLEIVLGGAVTANQLSFVSGYVDISQSTFAMTAASGLTGASNNTTAVTVLAAPGVSTTRKLQSLSVQNKDTAVATVTVNFNDNATLRAILKVTLAVNDSLLYTDGEGFKVIDTNGNIKMLITYPALLAAHVGGVWVADATWTLPALTLGGTITANSQSVSGALNFTNGLTLAGGDVFDSYDHGGSGTPVVADATSGGNVASGGTFTYNIVKGARQATITIVLTNIATVGMTAGNILYIRSLPYTTIAKNQIGACVTEQVNLNSGSPAFAFALSTTYAYIELSKSSADRDQVRVSYINSGVSDVWATCPIETTI